MMALPGCDCGAPAVVFCPGSVEAAQADLFAGRHAAPDYAWCLPCACDAGWPWLVSEEIAAGNASPESPGNCPQSMRRE